MATYLKRAIQKTEARDSKTKDIVKRILSDIRNRGESAVCELAAKFDARFHFNQRGDPIAYRPRAAFREERYSFCL